MTNLHLFLANHHIPMGGAWMLRCLLVLALIASCGFGEDTANAKLNELARSVAKITSVEATWEIVPGDASGKPTANQKFTNSYHVWMQDDKIRIEYTIKEMTSVGISKIKSKQVSVYENDKLTTLKMPEKALIRKSGRDSANGLSGFPPLGALQVFAKDSNSTAGPHTITAKSLAKDGVIGVGLANARLKSATGTAIETDYKSEPFPSPVNPSFMVGYGVSIGASSAWPTKIAYFTVDGSGKTEGAIYDYYENFKIIDDIISLPMVVRKTAPESDGKLRTTFYNVTMVKLNQPLDPDLFFIDPASADYVWDPNEATIIKGDKSTKIPAQ